MNTTNEALEIIRRLRPRISGQRGDYATKKDVSALKKDISALERSIFFLKWAVGILAIAMFVLFGAVWHIHKRVNAMEIEIKQILLRIEKWRS